MKALFSALILTVSSLALAQEGSASAAASSAGGPRSGTFGISTSLVGASLAAVRAPAQASTVGIRYFLLDNLALNVNAGVALVVGSGNTLFGFTAAGTVDYFFGAASGRLHPFVEGGVMGGKVVNTLATGYGIEADVGGGGEYWFSDQFSLAGRLLLGIPLNFNPTTVAFVTFTPSVRASFYF